MCEVNVLIIPTFYFEKFGDNFNFQNNLIFLPLENYIPILLINVHNITVNRIGVNRGEEKVGI